MSEQINHLVDEAGNGQRLDSYLAGAAPELSRSFVQKLIAEGRSQVNGTVITKVGYRVKVGDQVELDLPDPVELTLSPEEIPLDILFEDQDLLVLNKPRGMVVHPAVGNYQGTLVNALLAHCSDLSGINGVLRPGIVHRLDKDTSGLLMVAKNDVAHNNLSAQLQDRLVKRHYLALVRGAVQSSSGKIDAPIGRDPRNRQKMAVTHHNSKEAVTYYKVLQRYQGYTYLEARLETGRTHQIRVHLTYIGHPVIGDQVYGASTPHPQLNLTGQFLHATLLGFTHPSSGAYMEFTAPLPKELQDTIDRLRSE